MLVNWLLSRLHEDEDGQVEVSFLYDSFKFEWLESGRLNKSPSWKILQETMKTFFPNITKARRRSGDGDKFQTIYKGISLHPSLVESVIEFEKIGSSRPNSFCSTSTSHNKMVFETDSGYKSNGNKVFKTVTFNIDKTFSVSVSDKVIDLQQLNIDNTFELTEQSISTVFQIVQRLKLCNGMKFTPNMEVRRFRTLEVWSSGTECFKSLKSINCQKAVAFNGISKTPSCRICQQMFVSWGCDSDKENIPPATVSVCPESDQKLEEPPVLTATTFDNIKSIFPNAPTEMINMLVEQAKNVGRHPKGRRWSKPFIATCLQLFNRSPKCYDLLGDSKLLVLPSKSILILYKNALQQEPGFDMSSFEWMYEEAKNQGMTTEECIGGLIFDEMSIQSDIQIEKNGNVIELSGFTDLDKEGDLCSKLRKGSSNKVLGTHILQLLFLGLNGFRFPFAHFITDGIQASELYGLFWKAVKTLQVFGFKAIFTSMDGAQCNRSFMHICLGEKPTNFIHTSPCSSSPMIFMMDISHGIKKIRNNILKSGNLKTSTRLLTLPSQYQIHWQMFKDFFAWDQQNALQLHRKLTTEHFNLDSGLKMRNYLAEDVLDVEMLNAVKSYQTQLGDKGTVLNGLLELLQQTATLVQIFRDMRPIKDLSDPRLEQLKDVDMWFTNWEDYINNNPDILKKDKSRCLMSYQCHEDIHASVRGFLSLCQAVFEMKTSLSITPGLINSDVIENIFNQQRSTYNGANSNPTAYQYKKTINSIIVGQNIISKKANATASPSNPFTMSVKGPIVKRKPASQSSRENIKVVKM